MRAHPMRLSGDRNQCPTCGEHFNSSSAFDKHRTGRFGTDRRCRTVAEMLAAGMAKNTAGFWIERPRLTPTAPISGGFSGEGALTPPHGEKRALSTQEG